MFNRNILLDPADGDTKILSNVSNCLPSQHSLMSLKTWIFILNLHAKWNWLASHTPWTAFCNHQLGRYVGSRAGFEMPVKKKILFWKLNIYHATHSQSITQDHNRYNIYLHRFTMILQHALCIVILKSFSLTPVAKIAFIL